MPRSDNQTHVLTSRFQSGETFVRMLTPQSGVYKKRVFLLPVEPGECRAWGDPFPDILKHELHDRHALLFVMPSFSAMPWYADHPTDPGLQQESYFMEDVVPLVDQIFPARQEADRLLLGFSKSGWGAFSLLLRHGEAFARAAAWDAPLGMSSPVQYGAAQVFGTQENFEQYKCAAASRRRLRQPGPLRPVRLRPVSRRRRTLRC